MVQLFRPGHVQEHRVSPDVRGDVSKLHVPEARVSQISAAACETKTSAVDEDLYGMHFGRSGTVGSPGNGLRTSILRIYLLAWNRHHWPRRYEICLNDTVSCYPTNLPLVWIPFQHISTRNTTSQDTKKHSAEVKPRFFTTRSCCARENRLGVMTFGNGSKGDHPPG